MSKKNTFLFLLLIMMTVIKTGFASTALLKDCVFSYEFADLPRENIVVRAIGDICFKRCENECGSLSREYNGQELNQDIIDKCVVTCRQGNLFSSKIREPLLDQRDGGNLIYRWSAENVSTQTFCSKSSGSIDSADFAVYKTGVTVKANDKFMIDLIAPPGFEGNVVYLCGRQTTYLDISRGPYSEISSSNRDVWEARNPYYFDTKISPRDGDYLSIFYKGKYRFKCDAGKNCSSCYGKPKCICPSNTCRTSSQDYHLLVRDPKSTSLWHQSGGLVLPGGDLVLVNSSSSGDNEYPPTNLSPNAAANNNYDKEWKGLVPSILSTLEPHYGEPVTHINFAGYLGIPLKRTAGEIPTYDFSNISGSSSFSKRHARLGLKHYDGGGGKWHDNQGGFYGEVKWMGCSQFQGNRLQYSTIPEGTDFFDLDINEIEWMDLTVEDVMNSREISLESNLQPGEIIMRVKPYSEADFSLFQPDCAPNNTTCINDSNEIKAKYNSYNAFGQYYVMVTRSYEALDVIKSISDVIRDVKAYFFGYGGNEGLVPFIYKALISNTMTMNIIRAVLIFYIVFTGLAFMAGLSPITQREGAIRILKIGLVLTLISDQSWDFFYNGFFKLFVEGMTELIANIATPVYAPESFRDKILEDGSNIFMIFDDPLRILFSKITWRKVLGLMLTNIIGFLIAIVLGIACIITILVMIRAIIVYLVSLMVLAILIILAPIFITLILFGYTKQMFDNWFKQLIVYTLQPIFVFTAISILLHLLIIGVKIALSFSVCKICMLGFSIPFKDQDSFVCLIPGYVTLFGAYMPKQGFFSMPLANVGIVLYLLICAQALYAFSTFAGNLAIMIGSGQFVGFDVATMASRFSAMSFLTQDIAATVGMDKVARTNRSNQRRIEAQIKAQKKINRGG